MKMGVLPRTAGALGLLVALISGPVDAQDQNDGEWWRGIYLGASVGRSDFGDASDTADDIDDTLRSLGFTSSTDVDDTDVGWKLLAGYQFNKYFGIEASYVDFGEAEFDTNVDVLGVPVSGDFKLEATGGSLAATGTWPFAERFGVFGKVGALYWNAEIEGKVSASGVSSSLDEDDNGVSVMFGAGGKFDITEHLSLRVEWERYDSVGDEDKTGEADIDLISGGLVYRF